MKSYQKIQNSVGLLFRPKTMVWLVLIFLLSLMIFLASSTMYNTLSGDDMVFTRVFTNLDTIPKTVIDNYLGWTARISNMFTLNLIFAIIPGNILVHYTLIISLGLLGLSIWKLISSVFYRLTGNKQHALSLITGILITMSLCLYSVTTYDNFYWMAGVVTYVLPLVLFGFIVGYILTYPSKNKKSHLIPFLAILLTTIFMGLYNEAFILQCLALCLLAGMIISIHKNRGILWKKYFILLTAFLIGLVISVLIVKFSPGTAYRSELNASLTPGFNHTLLSLIKMTLKSTLKELIVFLSYNIPGVVITVIGGIFISLSVPRIPTLAKHSLYILFFFCLVPVISFMVLAFGVHYAYQTDITSYSLLTANYFTYLSIFAITLTLTQFIPSKLRLSAQFRILLCILIAAASIPLILRINHIHKMIILQKKESEETNAIILNAVGKKQPTVSIGHSELYFTYCVPQDIPTAWCNEAYKQYYDIKVVAPKYTNHLGLEKLKEGKIK